MNSLTSDVCGFISFENLKFSFFYTVPPWTQPMFWDEPFLGPRHFIKDIYETFLLSRSAHIIKEMQYFVMWTPSLFFLRMHFVLVLLTISLSNG